MKKLWKRTLKVTSLMMATIKRLIRKGTIAGNFVPVLTGTAFKNKGVQTLLDAVVDYMPSPLDIKDVQGVSVSRR